MLVDLPIEKIQELIATHLQENDMTIEMAIEVLNTYKEKFSN